LLFETTYGVIEAGKDVGNLCTGGESKGSKVLAGPMLAGSWLRLVSKAIIAPFLSAWLEAHPEDVLALAHGWPK
jgi:hypothetical protein